MNTGPDIFGLSEQTTYIGIVSDVQRVESEQINDKLGNPLKPFEILFNVGDIISGSRATPLVLSSEINVGDQVMIHSMESIYSNTFFYYPIRNLDTPRDSIKLKYNNATIELKPQGDAADIVISSANSQITLNSANGVININSEDGVLVNGGSNTVDIRNESQSLHELMEKFIDILTNLTVIVPDGQGTISPVTVNKLMSLSSDFQDLLGEVDESPYYPVIPDDTYTVEFVEDVVRDTGLDFLVDDDEYEKGDDVDIDELRDNLPPDQPPPLSPTPTTSTSTTGNVNPLPIECFSGAITDNYQLSTHYKLKHLSSEAYMPHKIRPQFGMSVNEIACNLKALAVNVLEPLRAQYPNLRVNSAFRTKNSVKNGLSQHVKGQAVDIQIPGISPGGYMPVANWIKQHICFDQMIFEHGTSIWLHISYTRGTNRKKLNTMYKGKYENGLKLYY